MKKLIGALCAFIVLFIAWYLFTGGELSFDAAKKQIVRQAQDAIIKTADPEDVAALAMRAITLTQGEHGAELWRLKAEWGNMRRRDNIMELEKPRFTYYMPPDNKPVEITSEKGDIAQEEQIIQFIDSVVATYEGKILRAPQMTYYGKQREIVCPRGGDIQGEGYVGSADKIVRHVNEQEIEATGNVDFTYESEQDILAPRREAKSAAAPGR